MHQTFSIGDMTVHVAGSGSDLVFCHGFTTTSAFWREQMLTFAKTNRVVALNLPGHGTSPSPRNRRYTINAYVDDLKQLFDALKLDKAVLVGLSMGGTIAQGFVLRYGELNLRCLRGLVLVGATSHGLGPDVVAANVLGAIDRQGIHAVSHAVIEASFGRAASRELLAFAKNEVIQTPEFVAREAIVSLNEADSRGDLARITLPTLVVCGEEDVITPPSESRTLAAGIPNSRLALVAKAGHFPMLEQPDCFNRVLRNFIEELGG